MTDQTFAVLLVATDGTFRASHWHECETAAVAVALATFEVQALYPQHAEAFAQARVYAEPDTQTGEGYSKMVKRAGLLGGSVHLDADAAEQLGSQDYNQHCEALGKLGYQLNNLERLVATA